MLPLAFILAGSLARGPESAAPSVPPPPTADAGDAPAGEPPSAEAPLPGSSEPPLDPLPPADAPIEPAAEAPVADDVAAPQGASSAEPTNAVSSDASDGPDPSTVAACPCDASDRQCKQANSEACERDAPAPAASDFELPPRAPSRGPQHARPREEITGPQRTGLVVGAGLGYLGCRTFHCEGFKGGVGAHAEIGYRFRFVAPIFIVGGGQGRIDLDIEGVRARLAFADVGAGALVFPSPRTFLDPYFGVAFGWSLAKITGRSEDTGVQASERLNRGAARFTFGLNFFLSPRVTLGPRFDITVPFAGRWCVKRDPPRADTPPCSAVRDLPMTQMIDPPDLPRSFAVTLHMRLIIPVPG